ncbi:MAG: competence/damage-inducible protein A [bacterium]|nr:competence/damage-inducible protein A [candidate division KSB1 bacterium]MDH7561429.1 competence/damage-inducible protein A [bacterium]
MKQGKRIVAELVTVGDELLAGRVANGNAQFLARALREVGVATQWMTTVGDDPEQMRDAFSRALGRAQVVVIAGGLGPTPDDLTREVVAELLGVPLVVDEEAVVAIRARFATRGLRMSANNERQAQIPRGATVLRNPLGTAPGFMFRWQEVSGFALPGVPAEMRAMVEQEVLPRLQGLAGGWSVVELVVRTTGIPESTLAERLSGVGQGEEVRLAYQAGSIGVDVRLTAEGPDRDACRRAVEHAAEMVRQKAGEFIYGTDNRRLEEAVGELLNSAGKSIAVAESCTGGLVAHRLTNVSGSSAYFERGVVAYSNQAKVELLGVAEELIARHGAVSPEVAQAMAEGVRRVAKTDLGLSTTGIAGPTGGTPTKPVGLVYIGFCDGTQSLCKRCLFPFDRLANKERAAAAALDMVRRHLLGWPLLNEEI